MSAILFVDDHADILEANRSYFAQRGFETVACERGELALAALLEQSFDCVVLDVMMPGMDGYDVCSAIRKQGNTPVIFLSCLDQPDDKIKGLMLGGDAYITKPYDLRELHAQVMACIRRGEAAATNGGDFFIDWEKRVVRLYERSAILSKKEMRLLFLLTEQADKVLYKEALCAAIWPGETVDENRLQGVVRNLRRKIDFAKSRVGEIVSVYGLGYKLESRREGEAK